VAAAGTWGMMVGMTYTGVLLDVSITLVMLLRQLLGAVFRGSSASCT
jgi:hypothetical protein